MPKGYAHLPAVHSNRSILSKLLLGFVNLANKVYEALSSGWYSLLRPVSKLELTDGLRLSILVHKKTRIIIISYLSVKMMFVQHKFLWILLFCQCPVTE